MQQLKLKTWAEFLKIRDPNSNYHLILNGVIWRIEDAQETGEELYIILSNDTLLIVGMNTRIVGIIMEGVIEDEDAVHIHVSIQVHEDTYDMAVGIFDTTIRSLKDRIAQDINEPVRELLYENEVLQDCDTIVSCIQKYRWITKHPNGVELKATINA